MKEIKSLVDISKDRFDLWIAFINKTKITSVVEIGVFKGDFAEKLLTSCNTINRYLMIDPWKHLDDWNKPANVVDDTFEDYFKETMIKTEFAKDKREVLRGRTQDVQNDIENNSLDLAYIDGDHTLRGISVDLIAIWDKIKPNGFIAGDDFCSSIWQHDKKYEPSLVFPFAIYFAEAKNVRVYGLPFNQFLIEKGSDKFEFIDLTKGTYKELSLLNQFETKVPDTKKTFIQKLLS